MWLWLKKEKIVLIKDIEAILTREQKEIYKNTTVDWENLQEITLTLNVILALSDLQTRQIQDTIINSRLSINKHNAELDASNKGRKSRIDNPELEKGKFPAGVIDDIKQFLNDIQKDVYENIKSDYAIDEDIPGKRGKGAGGSDRRMGAGYYVKIMTPIKISIIIPVYHEEKIINNSIQNIFTNFKQKNYEIIIVDGDNNGSTIKKDQD